MLLEHIAPKVSSKQIKKIHILSVDSVITLKNVIIDTNIINALQFHKLRFMFEICNSISLTNEN